MKALIIDDENDICYLLSRLLNQKNLETSYVNNLSDATTALKKNNQEIIFLDNNLPDGLGVNFLKYIKSNYPDSKIVMITAQDMNIEKQRAFKAGADYFISKPFSRATIYKTVDELMN